MEEMNVIFRMGKSPNELIVRNTPLLFDYPIQKLLQVSEMVIILLEIPPKTRYNKNVFGISLIEKCIKWQINFKNLKSRLNKDCPFTNILIYENKLRLNNWCSFDLIVDAANGEILEELESR